MKNAAARSTAAFEWAYGQKPTAVARAPGRVNLVGDHVDYNDGFVMPVAVGLDIVVAASPRADRIVRIVASDLGQRASFHLDRPGERRPEWTRYAQGVAAVIESIGIRLTGADLAVAGDIPARRGMASSAALEVALARAMLAVARRVMPDLELVELCHRSEQEWIGTRCGVVDPYPAVFARADHAAFLDCRTLDSLHIPVPDDIVVVVMDAGTSGVTDGAVGSARAFECGEAARLLGVRRLRDVSAERLEADADRLPPLLLRRVRHVVSEIDRTREAAAALEAGALWRVGRCMNESHDSLREDFEITAKEPDMLVHLARAAPGVYGSRICASGWGGSTVTLLSGWALDGFRERVTWEYRRATGNEPVIRAFRPASGASVIEDYESDD